jgi:hypothetical protein
MRTRNRGPDNNHNSGLVFPNGTGATRVGGDENGGVAEGVSERRIPGVLFGQELTLLTKKNIMLGDLATKGSELT